MLPPQEKEEKYGTSHKKIRCIITTEPDTKKLPSDEKGQLFKNPHSRLMVNRKELAGAENFNQHQSATNTLSVKTTMPDCTTFTK
jgi:hypothetical protein